MENIRDFVRMAKLSFSEEEFDRLCLLAGVLEDGFSALSGIDTDGVEPLVTVLNIKNVFRDDIAQKMISREELLKNAPEQYDGYFRTPKTLD